MKRLHLNADALATAMDNAKVQTKALVEQYTARLADLRTWHKSDKDADRGQYWALFMHRNVWRDADTIGHVFKTREQFIRFAFQVPDDAPTKAYKSVENKFDYLCRLGRIALGIGAEGQNGGKGNGKNSPTVASVLKYLDKALPALSDADVAAVARRMTDALKARRAVAGNGSKGNVATVEATVPQG